MTLSRKEKNTRKYYIHSHILSIISQEIFPRDTFYFLLSVFLISFREGLKVKLCFFGKMKKFLHYYTSAVFQNKLLLLRQNFLLFFLIPQRHYYSS